MIMAQSSPRSSSGKAPARPRAKGGSSRSAQTPQPEPTQPGFLARFFSAVGRAGIGAVRSWKATDAQVKRDAAAFVVVAAAIVIALREWFQISGEAGDAIHHASAGLFGIFSVVLPLVLIALAVELVTARSGRSALPHHVAGGIGITAALTGLVHISRGNPGMADDPGIEAAGGQQDRVREEQEQEGASTPAGQEKSEGPCDEPADEATSGLDARVVSHTGVSA